MFVALPHQVCRPATDRSQPNAVGQAGASTDRS